MDSNDVRREWEERSGAYSPDYYAYYGPDETSESLRAVLDDAVDSDASILELGCSSGRHLAHLLDHGYHDLHGVDINDEAFEVMADNYPDLASRGTFHVDAIESFLPSVEDDRFDVVYSVETLQHIHPDDSHVFADVARVASDLLVTVENEGSRDESQEESGDERPDGDDEGGSEERTSATAESDADRGVNYVHDEFPLYYRDWEAVFTDLGFVQTASRATDRDTMRVFRPER
ncbi:Methyltransferase domain-containing protein [Halogranum amylolyticum]|uniref:Methyltransferase domain-containing protein n=1 Tax=Halogranum amylolyticum TaxID=660520 RepID=A0A1H8NFU7_9EURY|nr:class I SAM-dependent methyltransferase [Halogranum amylolyticum]SEO28446.1 Methyltransferase domain-containing protein [Halogranum amylolyticum]